MRVFIPLNIFLLCMLTGFSSAAQNCDCDDTTSCPASFDANFTGQICYDITDAVNDDLADPLQGICGVNITFTHQHVWDLELTLVSPSGQTLPLVGFNTNFFGTTNNVLWNVLFIPCANIPAPDTINNNPYQPVWTNNQSWPFAAIFNGSYHPVAGNCLESFNSGPVNGTWCLQIENQPSPYSGQILNFEVILCDNSGLLCCDADAGALDIPDFSICQGDSSLLLDWEADYGPIFPSPAEYGYSFVVSDTSGTILLIEAQPDLTGFAPDSYSVCGLSYLLTDSLNVPAPNGVLSIGDLIANLDGAAPWFCGDLTADCVLVGIVAPPPTVFLTETICEGETFMVGDSLLSDMGQYTFTLQNAFQCDSIVELDLTVVPIDSSFLTETVCFGGSFAVGDSIYNSSGNFTTPIQDALGCDSLVFLDLTVLQEIETFLVDTICQGDAYAVGGSLFSASGSYIVPLLSTLGCDSTVFLDLSVLAPAAVIALPDTLTCASPQVVLDGSGSGAGLSFLWTALSGTLAPPFDAPQVTALSPGVYELLVMEFFCSSRDTVEVFADTLPPPVLVLPPAMLTCEVDSVLLDGSGSGSGADIVYEWLDPQGLSIPGANSNTLWAFQTGDYTLIATNTSNGCQASELVTVAGDFQAPFVDAGPGFTLNCQDVLALLDGSPTYQDGNFFFEWLDQNGTALAWTDSLQAETAIPGMYFLTATDLGNGCAATDSVEVLQDIIAPQAEAGANDTLDCSSPLLDLNGSGSSNSGQLEYFWATQNGNLLGDPTLPNPQADAPGIYQLTVTDPVNHCTAQDSVEIFQDISFPMADAGPPVTLTCLLPSWSLGNPDSTSLGPEFGYIWIGPAGDTISNQLSPEIFQGGTYLLIVTNLLNGCASTDAVIIGQEGSIPMAVLGPGGTLTCADPVVLLDGSGSSSGPFIEYTWLDDAGNSIGQTNQLSVGNAGVYCLVVEDGLSLCADTVCVEVFQGPGFPLVNAGPNEELDCLSGQAFLQGTVQPFSPNNIIEWTTVSGNILTGPNLIAITVDEPGWYTLTVTDTSTTCTVLDSAFVSIDTAACLPPIDAGADGLITCYNVPFDTLDASQGTATGLNIVYQWTAISGSVFSGENTLFPVVTEGIFVLSVTNTSLNITATDTVIVPENLVFPIANAGDSAMVIDCATISNDFFLDGTGSSQGSQYIYQWSTSGGFIVSGIDGLTPLINAPGLYDLEVTDTLNGCTSTDAILITLDGVQPTPCIPASLQIPCGFSTIMAGDTCAAGNPYAYEWFVSGGLILGDPSLPIVELEWIDSTVLLTGLITDTTNMCPVVVSMELFAPSACFPNCDVATPDTLTCDVTILSLDASGSSIGPDYAYFWEAISGNLCGGETTLFPCVDAPGIYQLTVTDTSTLFTCTQNVFVLENTNPPPVDAGPDGFFTCNTSQALLQAGAGTGLSYQWTSAQGPGCIISGDQTPAPLVSCPGVYYLEATSASNGCSAIDSAEILFDTIPPLAVMQVNGNLTCADSTVLLSSLGSDLGSDITYQWSLDNIPLATGLANWTATSPGLYCLTLTNENTGCFSQACDSVFLIDIPPSANAGPDTVLTCGITSVVLSGTPGAGGNLAVIWSTPDGCLLGDPLLSNVQIACPGLYIYEVADILTGCTGRDSLLVVSQVDAPQALIMAPEAITCSSLQVQLDGSASLPQGELNFLWTTSDGVLVGAVNGPTAMAADSGTYQLVVQHVGNLCTDTATVFVINEIAFPLALAGPDTVLNCFQPEILLDGSGSSQGINFTYVWTPPAGVTISAGGNTLFPQIDQPGIYSLTVEDTGNACISTDTVVVGADFAAPNAQIDPAVAPLITCVQEEIPLSGLLSQPAGMLGFSWFSIGGQIQGDPNAADIEALSAGIYFLEIQNLANGCLDTASLEVELNQIPPQIQFALPDTLTCTVDNVVLDASGTSADGPFDIIWTGPGPISGGQTLMPGVVQAGFYVLEVTDQNNGCVALDSIQVFQDTLAPQAIAFALGGLNCEIVEVGLSGQGSSAGPIYSYYWTGQPGNPVLDPGTLFPTVFSPGWYVLTVTNGENGCIDTAGVAVLAEAFPITGLEIELIPPSCFGDLNGSIRVDTVFGGIGPFLFSFDGTGFYPHNQFNYLPAGNYVLSVEDANGCTLDTLVFLPAPNELFVDAGPDQYIQLGEEVSIEALVNVPDSVLASVQWIPYSDPDCPECLFFDARPTVTTAFEVTVRDEFGCVVSDFMTVFVEKESWLYMPTAFSPNDDGENDVFFPQSGPEVLEIELFQIFDRWGDLVFQAREFLPNDPAFGWDGNFEGRPMNSQVLVWQTKVLLRDGSIHWLKGGVLLAR